MPRRKKTSPEQQGGNAGGDHQVARPRPPDTTRCVCHPCRASTGGWPYRRRCFGCCCRRRSSSRGAAVVQGGRFFCRQAACGAQEAVRGVVVFTGRPAYMHRPQRDMPNTQQHVVYRTRFGRGLVAGSYWMSKRVFMYCWSSIELEKKHETVGPSSAFLPASRCYRLHGPGIGFFHRAGLAAEGKSQR